MRWHTKNWIGPNFGDRKESKVFAWIPIEIDGEWIWLEHYWLVKVYTKGGRFYLPPEFGKGYYCDGWVKTRIKL